MQRKIWTRMKDLFLAMQSKMLDVHASFNWESSFMKKYSDTQLAAIHDKVAELEKAFYDGISALQDAIDNPVEDVKDGEETADPAAEDVADPVNEEVTE